MSETVLNIRITVDDGKTEEWTSKGVAGFVIKEAPEQRYTLTVAYPVNKPDIAVARDGHRDFAGPEAIEKAAWSYLSESPRVGQWHADGTEGAGTVVESYIWRFDNTVVKAVNGEDYEIATGDWLIGIVWDPDAYGNFKTGEATGVSMQGREATRAVPTPDKVMKLRKSVASK